jgi:hypothetical protein
MVVYTAQTHALANSINTNKLSLHSPESHVLRHIAYFFCSAFFASAKSLVSVCPIFPRRGVLLGFLHLRAGLVVLVFLRES